MSQSSKMLKGLLASATLLAAGTATAGGPLANCADGIPFAWANGGQDITFNPDQGGLGPLNNAEANAQVALSFQAWENIPTSVATYQQGDSLPVDVDITNFGPFLEPVAPDGLSAIVYDDNGEIFDLLFGAGSGILGFAGPEWLSPGTCEIIEGVSFLNGPAFDDITAATDVMVHEFGHFSNLAHVQVNGFAFSGDFNGPGQDTFPLESPFTDVIETMYPFYFGPAVGTQTPETDDIISLSSLYPSPEFASESVTITGTVFIPNGETPVSGINVVARNVDNPYEDSTAILTGALTEAVDPSTSGFVGTYSITGLTPGANYQVFIDEIGPGGFSTTPVPLGPSPEEFYSGAAESSSDDPLLAVNVSGAAGEVISGIDIILNQPQPGDPLDVGLFGDASTNLSTPFPVRFCGEEYNDLFVNGNGNVTFGVESTDFSESAGDLLAGPPRIAGMWRDLNASISGVVTFDTDNASYFKVIWDEVPEFAEGGANSFSITLYASEGDEPTTFRIDRGDMTAVAGVTGYSCGGGIANGFENESNLSRITVVNSSKSAYFEQFTGGEGEELDLVGKHTKFTGVGDFGDVFELEGSNNAIADATPIATPFANNKMFAEIGTGDVDYYGFPVSEGETIAVEVVRGALDTIIALFDADTGDLLFVDDDGGNGLLSRALLTFPFDANIALAVTTFGDFGFSGSLVDGGGYVLSVRKYNGEVVILGDDDSIEIPLPKGFPFQGEMYDSVNLNSNGNLTFAAADPFGFSESVDQLVNGPPRIAPFWDDLDPSGAFGTPGIYIVENTSTATKVHGVSISEFFGSSPNYFTLEMNKTGKIGLHYGATARNDALVGISEGGGAADPGPTDLSKSFRIRAEGTIYENFGNGFFDSTSTTPFSDFDLLFDRSIIKAPR